MDKKQVKRFKKLLLKQRSDILSEIGNLEGSVLKKSQRDASGDLSGYVYHMADVGTDNYDREVSLNLVSNEQKILYEIDQALERIEEESFGICEACGDGIKVRRLEAVPYARLCRDCKEREELKSKGQ